MATPSTIRDRTVILITGANQGIGLAIARNMSSPSAYPNHHVIIGSRSPTNGADACLSLLAEDSSRSLSTVTIDVTSDTSISAAAATIEEQWGHLDVLINNAGIMVEDPSLTKTTRPIFQQTFDVNLFGAAACTEAFIPLLQRSSSPCPRIVFITSRLASLAIKADTDHPSSARNFAAYRCSKTAVNMLMLHYSSIFKNWKINSCDPGLTKTNFGGDAMNAIMTTAGTVEDAAIEACRLATLGVDGETGRYSCKEMELPW